MRCSRAADGLVACNIANCKSYTSKLLIILLILNDNAMTAL